MASAAISRIRLAVALVVLLLFDSSVAAYSAARRSSQIIQQQRQAAPLHRSSTKARVATSSEAGCVKHTPFNSEASLQIAARQKLFDYAVQQALVILGETTLCFTPCHMLNCLYAIGCHASQTTWPIRLKAWSFKLHMDRGTAC